MMPAIPSVYPSYLPVGDPLPAIIGGAGITGNGWLLTHPGDGLLWAAAADDKKRYLYIQYSTRHQTGQPPGALTVQAGNGFCTSTLPVETGGPYWLVVPLPPAGCALRLRNGYAQVTMHALHISAIQMPLQQHGNWCWAAVLCALQDYYYHPQPLTQAQWACRLLGQDACTAQNGCTRCRQPAFIHEALKQAGYLKGVYETAVTEDELKRQMRLQRPVIITQKAVHEPYGHYRLVLGLNDDAGYAVFDPRQQSVEICTYQQLLLGGGRFPQRWVNTYLTGS